MRKITIGIVFSTMLITFSACVNGKEETVIPEEIEEMKAQIKFEDNLKYLIDTYGLDEEELLDIDLEKLISDYKMRSLDYTAEEVRNILRDERDIYLDDGTTELFSIFDRDTDTDYNAEANIRRIAYYYNQGSLFQRSVFDLENGVFFVNTASPMKLNDEQLSMLQDLVNKWDILEWEEYYEGEEEPSTGSLRWKLVLEFDDDITCAFGGYTKDMTHLPGTYRGVNEELQSVIKTVKYE